MKAVIKRKFEEECDVDLAKYITNTLDGDDYDRGALEVISKTAENNSSLLAKLIDILARKGFLRNRHLLELFDDLDEIKLEGSEQ